jgi:hypothetical protein
MAGIDIQTIGKQLAYVVRGETKFKNFKRNQTCAGISMTFLGGNVSTGLKVEDQIALEKCLLLLGNAEIMRCKKGDSAYGTNTKVARISIIKISKQSNHKINSLYYLR